MITFPREYASVQDLLDMKDTVKKAIDELPNKKTILVTGDSWAAGEWDDTKGNELEQFEWRSKHSTGWYLEQLTDYIVINIPNPGWDDIESYITIKQLGHFADYIIFFKTCGLRAVQHEHHTGRSIKFGFDLKNFKHKNVIEHGLIVNHIIYDVLKKYESKLILLGGLNKIARTGLELKTIYTLPSIIEFFDHKVKDNEIFGWEDMWDFYKEEVKGDKEYRESLLLMMDVFAEKKKYLSSRPDLYWPDGKHPNAEAHKLLAEHIAGKI